MKKSLIFILSILLLFSACSSNVSIPLENESNKSNNNPSSYENVSETSYVENLALAKSEELGLKNMPVDQAIKTVYEYVLSTVYFREPVGLDCWRYLSEETEPIPYLENRSLSPLLFNIGSCEDFAAVTVMILNSAGIEAEYVAGFTLSKEQVYIDHAWVIVNFDGDWYHIDPQLEQNVTRDGNLSYRYFMKTDLDMEFDHKWGKNLIEYWSSMPENEKENILDNYSYPHCNTIYNSPEPKNIKLPPTPDMLSVETEINKIKQKSLPEITLNIEPPVLVSQYHITPPLMNNNKESNKTTIKYGKSFLNGPEIDFYSLLYVSLEDPIQNKIIKSKGLSSDNAKKVLGYFLDDNPLFYWVEIVPTKPGDYTELSLNFKDKLTFDEIKLHETELYSAADEILLNYKNSSDFEKALAIHDYLGNNAVYDYGFKIENSDNPYGAIVEKVAYCDGYARAFQFLADYAGLNNIYIKGRDLKGTPHAWNAVELDGNWYYVDVTWDRSSNSYGGSYHDFFAISLEECLKSRVWDDSQYPNLPESNSTQENFYIKNNYVIEISSESNPHDSIDEIASILNNQLKTKTNLKKDYSYSFVEFRVVGNNKDFISWKSAFTKELFSILKSMEKEARSENLPFSVSYDSEVSCYYNDSMQIVAFYPKVKLTEK